LATGFIAVAGPDLRSIHAVCRLPRGAGSITSAGVGADGSVYIAGTAKERIANLAEGRVRFEPGLVDSLDKTRSRLGYLAKLDPSLTEVLWAKTFMCRRAPKIHMLNGGDLIVNMKGMYRFAPDGQRKYWHDMHRTRASVNPVTGWFCQYGDWMTGTGREPYRSPYLYFYGTEGKLRVKLWDWNPALAAVDPAHLVADSSIHGVVSDRFGNTITWGWSHGGNTVMLRYPYDIDHFMHNALGYPAMTSPVYITSLGPDYNVKAHTVWMSAARLDTPGCAVDGSPAFIGRTSRGEILPNDVSSNDPKGAKAAVVLEPDLGAYRFYSFMPSCGTRVLVNRDESWAIVSGTLSGKPMVMFLTGAQARDEFGRRPPAVNVVQPYGGGLADGYVLLLDLSRGKRPSISEAPEVAKADSRTSHKRADAATKRIVKIKPVLPAEGQLFTFGKEKWLATKISFRAMDGKVWPTYFVGDADEGGTMTFGMEKAGAGFVLRSNAKEHSKKGPHVSQLEGEDVRHLCTPWLRSGNGHANRDISITFKAAAPWSLEESRREQRWRTVVYQRAITSLDGVLELGERKVPFSGARCTGKFTVPRWVIKAAAAARREPELDAVDKVMGRKPNPFRKRMDPNLVYLSVRFKIDGAPLGRAGTVEVRISTVAKSDVKYPDVRTKAPKASELELDMGDMDGGY
jgi:hypothetical protein